MRSIMHSEKGMCYVCSELFDDFRIKETEEHHIVFGTAQRKLSDRYGLTVHLCYDHHRFGKEAVHRNVITDRWLKERGQRAFETEYPELSFREIFGINFDPWSEDSKRRTQGR